MTAEKRKATTGHRIKWQGILIITLVFCSFFGIFDLPARAADQQENQKQVLFINSYGYDFETVPVVMKEVSERLSGIASVQYLFMNEKYINDMSSARATRSAFTRIKHISIVMAAGKNWILLLLTITVRVLFELRDKE